MRGRYRGWYPLEESERDKLWREGLIVLDTNVLLDLYRRSPASRKSLFASLESVSSRLWLPYQVGLEFHKMRENTRAGVAKTHASLADKVKSDTSALLKLVASQRDYNPAIDDDETLRNNLRDAADALSVAIRAAAKEYDEPEDSVLERLEQLYPEARIGRPFEPGELADARETAQDRIDRRVPPGFEDAGKQGDLPYGDYFLWRQIMDVAKGRESGVILVSRDSKRDWRHNKDALPELADEFVRETNSLFQMVYPQTFIAETASRGFWTPEDESGVEKATEEYERADEEDAALLKFNSQRFADSARRTLAEYYGVNPGLAIDLNRLVVPADFASKVAASTAGIDWGRVATALAAMQPALASSKQKELSDSQLDEDEKGDEAVSEPGD